MEIEYMYSINGKRVYACLNYYEAKAFADDWNGLFVDSAHFRHYYFIEL